MQHVKKALVHVRYILNRSGVTVCCVLSISILR